MGNSQTVIANVIVLLVKQIVTWSLTAVLILFLPRYLGDEGLGQVTFASSFTGVFVPLIVLGVPTYLVKEVARDKDKIGIYFVNSLVMRIPLSAAVFVIVWLSVNIMGYSAQMKTVVYLGCLTTIAMCLNDTASSILQGIENMRWITVADIAGKLVTTGVGILVLINGYGVEAYALVLLSGAMVALAINMSFFFIRRSIRLELDFKVWRTLLVGGFPFLITSVLLTVYQRGDTTILRLMTNDAVVGWYGAATQLFGTLNFVPILVGTAILPALSRMYSSNPNQMTIAAKRSISITVLVSLPMAGGTMLISDKIIQFLHFPEAFSNSVPLLSILSGSVPITGTLVIIGTVLMAADRQRELAKITAIGFALNTLLNVVGIPMAQSRYGNGAIGSAVAWVAAELLILIVAIRLLPAGVLDRSVITVLLKSLAGTGVMALVIIAIYGVDLPIVIAAGAAAYGVFSLLVKSVKIGELILVKDVVLKRRLAAGL